MGRVNSSRSASATSSRRGQIVAAEWSPGSPGGWNPQPNCPPPSPSPPPSLCSDNRNFGGRMPKRARAESGGGVADRAVGDGRDRISELPDPILLSVLSYLPLREAGRTAVLSTRWRRLFDQSLLDFNACQPFPPEEGRGCEWMIGAVTKILAARPRVPIRSFRFVMYGMGFAGRQHVVDRWFRDLAGHGVRELDVDMFYTTPKPVLPGSLLRFASLETLKVYGCRFPDTEQPLQLPVLRTIHLSHVTMSQRSLQAMPSYCTSLECMKLKNIVGVEKINIQSQSLARLYGDFGDFKELFVDYAPNLEELVGLDLQNSKVCVMIEFAPKLQVLGYLGFSVPLRLCATVFNRGIVQLRTLMRSVRTLAIQVPFSKKGYSVFFAQLLKCFPCLQVLHLEPDKRSVSRSVDVEEWDTANPIQCVEHSVNRVVFEYFGGEQCQWGFLTFLLGMARALKLVEFYCWKGKKWASEQVKLIPTINRASTDVDFMFFKISKTMRDLYQCHCCPGRCQKENTVALIEPIQSCQS